MEIVLERYRRAALRAASGGGNTVGNSTNARARNHHPDFDKRLQPRWKNHLIYSHKLFF